ncbi:MAG: hypothetical protein K2V38_28345 [Gemmataceae bacterium]|nr:hypothetical protein [Gemmataceae bacterium]
MYTDAHFRHARLDHLHDRIESYPGLLDPEFDVDPDLDDLAREFAELRSFLNEQ